MIKLYGNGIDDDYPAIQKMLDSGKAEIVLPAPEKFYLISKTLRIHSNQCLRLGRFTTIRLTPGANCVMIENDDFDTFCENICIDGGIWDMDHGKQRPNPFHFPDENGKNLFDNCGVKREEYQEKIASRLNSFKRDVYVGHCMRFCRIRRFVLKNVTIKNPVVFGVQMGCIEEFTISDVFFDYTEGSPKLWNMDGIHVEGNCKNGSITNLKGACHDDLVAITADDGLYGPISNILVDGIYAEGSHSAVRLLSHGYPVNNVTIRNVFGSFYVYCIGLTKYHGDESERGVMSNIVIENISACSCKGTVDVGGGNFPLLWVQKGVDVNGLTIDNVYREEKTYPTALLRIDEGSSVSDLRLRDVYQKNHLGKPIRFLDLDGTIKDYTKENVKEE